MSPIKYFSVILASALVGFLISMARADVTPTPAAEAAVETTPAIPPFGTPEDNSIAERNQDKIMRTLRLLEKRYGRDAVLLQGYALGLAVRSGAVLEAEASLPGFAERNGERFLEVRVASGIVFNDNDVSTAQRPMRIWTNIIEPSLTQLETITLPAPGLLFRVAWAHKAYKDEFDLREHLPDGRGDNETGDYYLRQSDVSELLAKRISSQELANRAVILVNGSESHLTLEPTPPRQPFHPPGEL